MEKRVEKQINLIVDKIIVGGVFVRKDDEEIDDPHSLHFKLIPHGLDNNLNEIIYQGKPVLYTDEMKLEEVTELLNKKKVKKIIL
ncbi:MAG TPA: hypothetical protein GXZ76_03855 [Clostridiaceae bacterium]|nr:hypothetical protein [Clostridiaceae bacterium]